MHFEKTFCHVVYVEHLDDGIHAFVQFFGAIQFWIQLGPSQISCAPPQGSLATLDPVTGEEVFRRVPRLSLPPFQEGLVDALLPVRKLNGGAARRGAKTEEMLKVKEIRVDGQLMVPAKPWVVWSWTGSISK